MHPIPVDLSIFMKRIFVQLSQISSTSRMIARASGVAREPKIIWFKKTR